MGDADYNKKLGEMQKYVPFLETTIKRLKSEKDKPREAQISKLQSLLVILTDSKKKLKLDALKKCEEVILKLYDKVEKKPPTVTMMHKYMCRTPPEEKQSNNLESRSIDPTFLVARQKLKQTDTTPASPSPPLEQQIIITKPVVIPTEKVITPSIEQPLAPFAPNWENYQNIPQTLNWPINAFNTTNIANMNQVWQDPSNCQNWTLPSNQTDLYKRRIDPDIHNVQNIQNTQHKKDNIWDRETITSNNYNKHKKIDREIINYSDALTNSITTLESSPNFNKTQTKIKIVGNNKEIIPIDTCPKKPISIRKSLPLPPAPQSRKSLEKEILPLNKPPLSDRDLQDLLSPVTESSSGGHSPIFNEDMDLDKLEELKAKLCKELECEKPKQKKKPVKDAPITPQVVNLNKKPEKPVKIVERVIKEPSNVFGSLLSSIDEQIMVKSKEKKVEKKEVKKSDPKRSDDVKKDPKRSDDIKKDPKRSDDIKKDPKRSDDIKKDPKRSDDIKKDPKKVEEVRKDPKKDVRKEDLKKKEQIKEAKVLNLKDIASINEKVKSVYLKPDDKKPNKPTEKPSKEEVKSKDNTFKVPTVKNDTKELIIPKEIDDNVFKTVEDIMKNLKESINKPVADPLSKFGDLVKEKSDQLCEPNPKESHAPSGRLSDKYPHKRKSIDSRASDSPQSDTNQPPKLIEQPVKLSDPRIRSLKPPSLMSPPLPTQHFIDGPPSLMQQNRHDFDQRNYNKPNPEFSFQNSYNNMNNPQNNMNCNNRGNIFCNEPQMPFAHQDDFPNAGCRTPGDQFMAGPPRTPGDPFLGGDPFINRGGGDAPPFMNQGPGPDHFFNQFAPPPNEQIRFGPPPNQFRNDFPQQQHRNQEPPRFNQNPNWNRGNNQFNPEFNDFNNPNSMNQYDLSQMNPIDFYDNTGSEFNNLNNQHGFRGGRGNCNLRGNFGRGRGVPPCPDRNAFRGDPRQFREPPHKEERRSRFDEPPRDRDYRRSRFGSKEDDHRNDRARSSDDRYNRFSSKREEPPRKPAFIVAKRKSIDEPKESKESKETKESKESKELKEKEAVVEKPIVEVQKTKEEIQSPLDSLYSMETKRVGKGYGLQSFKIPKIKKNEEIKEADKDKTTPEEVEDQPKDTPKEDCNKKEETQIEVPTAGPSTSEEPPKTEADLKLDMFNNFMKHIFETCDSSVLFQYLDRCGFSLPNAKTKRIRRIIDSDSSDTEDEKKEDSEPDKPTPEPPADTPKPETIVETVSERIKNRRRKQTASSSDSSPDKSQKKSPESMEPNPEEEQVRKLRKPARTQTKTRRKNALELLQEDIREMFISEGVLTATGKRMCRMMKEHQESGFISANTEVEQAKQQQQQTESEEEIPLVKRKEKLKVVKQDKSPEIVKRPTRKSPRVVLEKIDISKTDGASSDHSDKESGPDEEVIKKPVVAVRRTRRSNTVSGEFLELDENGVVAKVQEKKKKLQPANKSTPDEADALDTSFEDDTSIKSDSNVISKKEEASAATAEESKQEAAPINKKRRIRRRGRGGWATGVIKNKKKKLKNQEKNPDSPALTVSTEPEEEAPQQSGSDDEETPKAFDEEFSLLKVNVNEDVNYYLDNGNKFNCKLCDYKGKLIVHHYRSKHPESENMISRLSPEQASAAKIESNEFNFEEIIPYEEATKGKKRRTTFICRFCLLTFKQEFTCSFFDHICCHTGEYRYKCEKCTFSTGVKKTLSAHCHTLHPEMEKPLAIKPIYEGPPNFRLVFGYLCSACNFTQLLKNNVEKHIRVSHPDQDITIIKISMSTKPIPLTDLKKPGEDQLSVEINKPEAVDTPDAPESPKPKEPSPEPPKTPKRQQKQKTEEEPNVPLHKEKEPNLTVFMVPEEITHQEKLIEDERLKKMEEIQSNVVARRPKLQFIDKLKNKLDSVESEIALLESMEAENAAQTKSDPHLEDEVIPNLENLEDAEIPEQLETFQTPEIKVNDKAADDNWISIASTCSLANMEQQPEEEEEEVVEEEGSPGMDGQPEIEDELDSLDLPSSLSQNTKKSGFLDTIQRLAAQLQNNKGPSSSLSDCEDTERLYYSPDEATPENSPVKKTESTEAIKLNAGPIEIQFFGNKNLYSCLTPGCLYTSDLKTNFREHLMEEHKELRVNCGLCTYENDLMEWDLCGLFLHMLDQHKQQETPEKPLQIKEEPIEEQPTELPIKTEVFSPEKQAETLQPGSIRLRRISGDILSSFSSENSIEYPTISIPENVVSEPDINEMLGRSSSNEEEPAQNEPGFLQISNVRTLTPEEETLFQTKPPAKEPLKAFKKIIPKAYILNMGDLANSGVTKIVNNVGSAINLKRATNKEGTTYNFTLNPKCESTTPPSPKLLTKTITSDNKPTKTIIFRKSIPLDASGSSNVPKLTLLKSPTAATTKSLTLAKGFLANTARKITFVAPTSSSILKTPSPIGVKTTEPQKATKQFLQPLRLNKSEFILSIMTKYPKIMDFYKCPCVECIFSTNDRGKFREHFNAHNRILPGKYCVYCLSTVAPTDLIDHLEKKHGNCMYQCALCFYRASFDMYIAVHQSFCHQLDIPNYHTVQLNPNLSSIACGLEDGLLPRTEAILPYYCTLEGCNRTFYTMNDFRVHMKIFHKNKNECSICKFQLNNAELLVGHYVTHNIANFQCRYCKFGTEKPQIMVKHYAVEHYNKNPIVYKREYKSGTMSAHPNETARLEDILEINLSYFVKSSKCTPQQPSETQNHIPAAITPFAEETNEPEDISSVPTLINSDKNTPDELLIDPTTGELTPSMEKDGLIEPEITLKHRNEKSLKAIVDAIDPLNLDETNEENETEIETETEEYYEDSGLSGCELYICGTSDCGAKLSNLKDFKDHMYSCDVLTNDVGWYTCFHCKKRFKYVGALIKHLSVHGPQKYTCSLCPAKAHLETLIIKHMKVQHKQPLAKIMPIDKTNPDSDFVVVGIKARPNNKQKSKKDDEIYEKELQDAIKHTREQIELIQSDASKSQPKQMKNDDGNCFGPEDVDKLPRPPIFAQEIRCKICSYNTKVRSNMLKHLKAHIENKPVAETAPVNPVPCLEKNELMFDKMTNLAASSHSGGRMGPKNNPDKSKDKKTPVLNYPGFIVASKRFVCGSINCNYLTHGDSMLRHHLTALHIDESAYKCPHCQLELAPDGLNVLAVDNILFHLKMHDLHLYKCNECQFYHYQKHKIERHALEEHPNTSGMLYTTLRELNNSANLEGVRSTPTSPEKTLDPEETLQYPWRCGFCDYKSASRTGIQSHAANIHKIRSQFKCGSCEFRCSAKNNYQTHFKNKHPNEKVVILSVYYKVTEESGSNLSSSDVEKSFDTTPLWTKNRTGVKHIRGILLDDAPISKRPKIIEKLSETEKSPDSTHNLQFPPSFGANRNRFYVCPTCNTYETKNSKQFVIHLYKEINYFRYMCNYCPHKSTHMADAQKHFKESHSMESVVSNKQICTVLRYYAKAEKWVEKCLQIQQEGIVKYEAEQIKQEAGNSSTETLLLQGDQTDLTDLQDLNEETPEKPQLTPQSNRRSSRVSLKPNINLNENFEYDDELPPPVLMPEIPEITEIPEIPEIAGKSGKPARREFKCKHCSFVAKVPGSLQKHVKKHFETKPYKCNLCSYAGSQLAHLQSHFYFKHTSEPLQYTLDPIAEVTPCRPVKRKRAISVSEAVEQPVPLEPISVVGVVKAEPQPPNEMAGMSEPLQIKAETSGADLVHLYLCYHCPRRSPTLDLIREHFNDAHEATYKNIFKYKKVTIDKPRKTKYSCQYCEWMGHPDGMKQHHLEKHIDKEYLCVKDVQIKCEACPEVFHKLGALKKHFNQKHPNRNIIYKSVTKENNDEYIETVEIIEEIMQVKMEKNTPEINCTYCILSFTDVAELRAHHELVHNHLEFNVAEEVPSTIQELKKYKCPQCDHTSNSFPAMRDHLRNHNKPYKCGHCDLTASYPSTLKTHHIKEHRNLEPSVVILNDAKDRNEELRDNLLHLQNGEYVKMKVNLKRQICDVNADEPPKKLLALDAEQKRKQRRKSTAIKDEPTSVASTATTNVGRKINVARKSTATPPRMQNVAKKSTTPRPYVNLGFSYYGTKPLAFDEIKNIKTEVQIMGKNVPLNIGSMSQILQLFPVVVVDDIEKTSNI